MMFENVIKDFDVDVEGFVKGKLVLDNFRRVDVLIADRDDVKVGVDKDGVDLTVDHDAVFLIVVDNALLPVYFEVVDVLIVSVDVVVVDVDEDLSDEDVEAFIVKHIDVCRLRYRC
jgi:hypothetical protein